MRNIAVSGLIWLLVLSSPLQARTDPLVLVKSTADKVLSKVVEFRQQLQNDPGSVYALVSKEVLPHFDFQLMTRTALGKYWRRASEEQRNQIENEFRQMLVRTYAVALLNYSGQEIEYLPVKPSSDPDQVTVETRVSEQKSGPTIPVDYRLEYLDDRWLVYDVVIDGISLVSNYRTSFSGEIRRGGIDGLIQSLQANNREN